MSEIETPVMEMGNTEEEKEAWKRGYSKGYSDKKSAVTKARKEEAEKYKETLANLEITSMYPYNLIMDICDSTDKDGEPRAFSIELFNEVLLDLTERESLCIKEYYKEHLTLDEIGKRHMITRERVRQILAKAERKLKHPARVKRMQAVSLYDYLDLLYENKKLKAENETLRLACPYPELKDEPTEKTAYDLKVDEVLNLSMRTSNCLKRAGIFTIGDLTEKTETEMMRIRNFGKRSLTELKLKMGDKGYGFKVV